MSCSWTSRAVTRTASTSPAAWPGGLGDGVAVIMISTRSEADYADMVADCPAAGFLPKDELSAAAICGSSAGGDGVALARLEKGEHGENPAVHVVGLR
jgi:hypothetical protein